MQSYIQLFDKFFAGISSVLSTSFLVKSERAIVSSLIRAVARSENPGGLVVLGGDNVPPPGRDRVN